MAKQLAAKWAIVLAAISFLGGIVAAGSMGYGPLGFISYKIEAVMSSYSSSSSNFNTIPVSFDLGSLKPGDNGTVVDTAKLSIGSSGYYKFELENYGKLKKVFSVFKVTVTLSSGDSFTLDIYSEDDYKLYLDAGDYNITVEVIYKVKDNPKEYLEVSNMLFLKVEYEDSDDYSS